jgi:hypothetical protein
MTLYCAYCEFESGIRVEAVSVCDGYAVCQKHIHVVPNIVEDTSFADHNIRRYVTGEHLAEGDWQLHDEGKEGEDTE